jgi:GNAT superfamily N-acetyltransferase
MSDALDVHAANAAEREQAFANLHDSWGRGLAPKEHLRWRLANVKHQNAVWYVGVLEGHVVTGCGAYEFELRIDGDLHRACAFGEVHTLPAFRGRGLAPRLIARVEEHQRSLGKTVSLLYSDIDTSYYERLGYATCPSPEGWVDPHAGRSATSAPGDRLTPFDPRRELDAMAGFHSAHHAGLALSVERSRLYADYLVARSPGDEFLWLEDGRGKRLGYARLASSAQEVKIRDLALVERTGPLFERLLDAILARAAAHGATRAGGWLPAMAAGGRWTLAARRSEITMLKSLDPRLVLEKRHLDAAEHFHEMDHV